jgi:hypothetical protein
VMSPSIRTSCMATIKCDSYRYFKEAFTGI